MGNTQQQSKRATEESMAQLVTSANASTAGPPPALSEVSKDDALKQMLLATFGDEPTLNLAAGAQGLTQNSASATGIHTLLTRIIHTHIHSSHTTHSFR